MPIQNPVGCGSLKVTIRHVTSSLCQNPCVLDCAINRPCTCTANFISVSMSDKKALVNIDGRISHRANTYKILLFFQDNDQNGDPLRSAAHRRYWSGPRRGLVPRQLLPACRKHVKLQTPSVIPMVGSLISPIHNPVRCGSLKVTIRLATLGSARLRVFCTAQ